MEQIIYANRAIAILGLNEGDAALIAPQTRWDCDCHYLTQTGDVVRLMQGEKPGVLWITRDGANWTDIVHADADAMIAARVLRVRCKTKHLEALK